MFQRPRIPEAQLCNFCHLMSDHIGEQVELGWTAAKTFCEHEVEKWKFWLEDVKQLAAIE